MRWFVGPLLAAGLLILSGNSLRADVAPPTHEGREVPPACMARMIGSHEALQRLDFTGAEALGMEAEEMVPNHPLPPLFMAGVYLYWIQENESAKVRDKEVVEKFYKAADRAMVLAREQEEGYPESAYPQVYLGVIYGTRGMVNLHQGSYWTAYMDGRKAMKFLREAVKRDPENEDVYFGLGQFEYYCGRLAGVLQFMLGVSGDEDKGIEMMRRSAANGTYSSLPSRAFLSQVFTDHRQEWKHAAEFVDPLYERFPENHHYARYSLMIARGLGLDDPSSRMRIEKVAFRWDQGWRPRREGYLDLEPARLDLADRYLAEEKDTLAKTHLEVLAKSSNPTMAEEALERLKGLEKP